MKYEHLPKLYRDLNNCLYVSKKLIPNTVVLQNRMPPEANPDVLMMNICIQSSSESHHVSNDYTFEWFREDGVWSPVASCNSVDGIHDFEDVVNHILSVKPLDGLGLAFFTTCQIYAGKDRLRPDDSDLAYPLRQCAPIPKLYRHVYRVDNVVMFNRHFGHLLTEQPSMTVTEHVSVVCYKFSQVKVTVKNVGKNRTEVVLETRCVPYGSQHDYLSGCVITAFGRLDNGLSLKQVTEVY